MKKSTYLIALAFGASTTTFAQNVGINTDGSDPDANTLLHLNNDAGSSLDSALLRIENEKATTGTGVQIENSGTASSKWDIIVPGSSTDLRIKGNGSDHVTIQNDGDVGIGTTSPSSLLHIAKTSIDNSIQDQLLLECHNNASGNGNSIYFKNRWNSGSKWGMARIKAIEQAGYGGQLVFETNNGSGTADETTVEAMRIDENQNVGIGTNSPTAKLDVDGSAIFNESGAAVDFRVEGDTDTDLLFVDGSADKVGIGTNSPTDKFHISSDGNSVRGQRVEATNTTGNAWAETRYATNTIAYTVGVANGTTTYQNMANDFFIYDMNASVTRFTISSAGNVGLSVYDPTYKLQVNGQPAANGYTAFTDYSDRRLKRNIDSLDSGALDKILKLNPVSFQYNEKYLKIYPTTDLNRVIKGFIAQEIREVFPEMVHEMKESPDSVKYLDLNLSHLQVYIVKAMQEQQAIIEAQKKEIETQKAELGAQKVQLDSKTSENAEASAANAEEIESLKAQVQQLLQLIQQQESALVTD